MGVTLTNEMINGAISAQEKYGVPASVTLGQIMLESGGSYPGGMSGLAYNDNNLFGIKAGSSWKGKTATYKTQEYVNGSYQTVNAKFRKYDSVAQSIDDHGKLLNSSTYTSKTKNATNLNEYVSAMGGVYATSPTYAKNLMSIIEKNNLTQYDNGSLPTGTSSGSSGSVSSGGGSVSSGGGSVSSGGGYPATSVGFMGIDWQELLEKILSNLVKFTAIVLILCLVAIFFMQAFDLPMPTKSGIKKKVVEKAKKKVGESHE